MDANASNDAVCKLAPASLVGLCMRDLGGGGSRHCSAASTAALPRSSAARVAANHAVTWGASRPEPMSAPGPPAVRGLIKWYDCCLQVHTSGSMFF